MAKLKLKVGIFHVQFGGKGNPTLLDVVRQIDSLKGKARVRQVIEDPIRPRNNIKATEECCTIDFSRIPQINGFDTSDLEGNEERIKFAPGDPKPCKYTLVLLDPKSNTMYVQEGTGSSGIGHTTVCRYLKVAANLQHFTPSIILNENGALERLRDKKHRVFKVRIAGLANAASLKAQGLGDGAILDTLKAHRSPNVFVNLNLGKEPGQLQNVLETASALIGWNSLPALLKSRPVKEIVIGEGDEHEENLVNLLEDRLSYTEVVHLDRSEDLGDAQRHRAVTNAFAKLRGELRRRFPVANV